MLTELEATKKFYSCRYDRTFKEVFLKEENEDLLVTLLELTLSLKRAFFDILKYLSNFDERFLS